MYKRMEVGQIKFVNGGFQIRFIANASPRQLEDNPNCPWGWRVYATSFETEQKAMDFIVSRADHFYNNLFDGIKDGTFR